jgi:hypothetical protein
MQKHGMMNPDMAINPDEIVHPGDYIVTHPKGKYYPLRPEDFERMYEPYEAVAHPPPKIED